jgi:hypothetical protein
VALAEGGLVPVALAGGAWLHVAPFATLAWDPRGLAAGMAGTAPLLLLLWWCLRARSGPIARLVRLVEDRAAPLFAGANSDGSVYSISPTFALMSFAPRFRLFAAMRSASDGYCWPK